MMHPGDFLLQKDFLNTRVSRCGRSDIISVYKNAFIILFMTQQNKSDQNSAMNRQGTSEQEKSTNTSDTSKASHGNERDQSQSKDMDLDLDDEFGIEER